MGKKLTYEYVCEKFKIAGCKVIGSIIFSQLTDNGNRAKSDKYDKFKFEEWLKEKGVI